MAGNADIIAVEDNVTDLIVAFLWFFSCTLMIVEPIRSGVFRNLSVNMLLCNLVGSTFHFFHDCFGYFYDREFSDRVHWSEVFISLYFMAACAVGIVLCRKYCGKENDFDYFGIGVCTAGIATVGLSIMLRGNSEIVFVDCLMVETAMYLGSFIAQITLLAKSRNTRGWSMEAVFFHIVSSVFIIIDVFFDFIMKSGDKSLLEDLDYRRIARGVFSILLNVIIIYQFSSYKKYKFGYNKYMMDIEEMKISLLSKAPSAMTKSFAV